VDLDERYEVEKRGSAETSLDRDVVARAWAPEVYPGAGCRDLVCIAGRYGLPGGCGGYVREVGAGVAWLASGALDCGGCVAAPAVR